MADDLFTLDGRQLGTCEGNKAEHCETQRTHLSVVYTERQLNKSKSNVSVTVRL